MEVPEWEETDVMASSTTRELAWMVCHCSSREDKRRRVDNSAYSRLAKVKVWVVLWAAWVAAWAVEWEEGEDGMAEECVKEAWTGEWEEEWEVAKGQEEEVGLVSNQTLVVSRVDSGLEVATQAPQSGVVGNNREGAEVSPEVVGGGFNQAPNFSKNVPIW